MSRRYWRFIKAVDRALATIVEQMDTQTTVVIFSVHGMAGDYAQGHLVRPLMKKINEVFLDTYCRIPPKRAWRANSVIPYLRKAVPPRWQYAVGASSPDAVRQWVVEKEMIGGLDWKVTPAFALRTDIRTELRLNLIGRESEGMLEPQGERRDAYVRFMKAVFLELCDRDTGARLVDEILDTHEIFPGDRTASLPDFVLTWHPRPFVKHVYSPFIGDLSSDQQPGARGGDHTDDGFAIVPSGMAGLHPLQHIKDIAAFSKRFLNMAP